jgi:hypothetical protein
MVIEHLSLYCHPLVSKRPDGTFCLAYYCTKFAYLLVPDPVNTTKVLGLNTDLYWRFYRTFVAHDQRSLIVGYKGK